MLKMRYIGVLMLLLLPGIAKAQNAVAWFTDASIYGNVMPEPADTLPSVPGTNGNGVSLTKAVPMDCSSIEQGRGFISFWIKPEWNGNDSQTHKLVRIGDPASNGLLIEKSSKNVIRYVMAGGGKVTAARYDVSDWKAGEWHQIAVSWLDKDYSGKPLALPLWIDKIAVDAPIYGGDAFMNPTTMADKRIWIGNTSSNAVMDEFIYRQWMAVGTMLSTVYQDYWLTAPFTDIQIDSEPNKVKAEPRVIAGYQKQFGLKALMQGKWVRVTNFDVRYGQWGDFDAKSNISWSSSNSNIAYVNYYGMVYGSAVGQSTLTATFRGMTATYNLDVISCDKPDLDVMYVERTPRYLATADQKWPTPGQNVQSIAHIGNFGYQTILAGTVVKFELIPDLNGNFKVDSNETAVSMQTATINKTLAPYENTTVTFNWPWTQSPVFVRVTVDPDNAIPELCEVNNQRCELNIARAFHWGYNTGWFQTDHQQKHINHVGSFSDYDWCNAETDRGELLMRESVLPCTSPDGIQDSIRVDNYLPREYGTWESEPYVKDWDYYDGGFPDMEPQNSTLMDVDAAILHEIGHTTFGLPDLYGQPTATYNMFLKDENGQPYADTQVYPQVNWTGDAMYPSSYDIPCGGSYVSLMVFCHQWLNPTCAGLTQHYRQTRKGLPQTVFSDLIPKDQNKLQVLDVEDQPLKGAAVYVYQIVNPYWPDMYTKYFPDRPKFMGNTDDSGVWVFPRATDVSWDDWTTDKTDGAVSAWNPFKVSDSDVVAPSYVSADVLLLKIVSGDKVEFQTMPMTTFMEAFFNGNTSEATYTIRTSLASTVGVTPVVRPIIPDAIKTNNLKPVAVVPTLVNVKRGQSFTIDASQSYDPEGQPLQYRWIRRDGWSYPSNASTPVLSGTASWDYSDTEYWFYVMDGLRYSDYVSVIVHVVPTGKITGRVLDANGYPVYNAIVGIKTKPGATADAENYAVTDIDGCYTSPVLKPGYYYIAAWKDGTMPSTDTSIYVSDDTVTQDLHIDEPCGRMVFIDSKNVFASNTSGTGGAASFAVDSNMATGWSTVWWPTDPVYYYIDLGQSTDINDMLIYRYLETNDVGGSADSYQIDTMIYGSPLDPNSWQNNPMVQTVYSADNTLHGYPIQSNIALDPIRLNVKRVRGIRLKFSGIIWPAYYKMLEIRLHSPGKPASVSDIKSLAVNSSCLIEGKEVVATDGGGIPTSTCFIEESDRSSGLRINLSAVSGIKVNIGDRILATGTVKSITTGEKFVSVSTIEVTPGTPKLKPMGMNNQFPASSKMMPVGLLAKVWGKVDSVGSNYFIISTGSKATVKVMSGSLAKPAQGKFVAVKGIVSTDGTKNTILLQKQADWTLISN